MKLVLLDGSSILYRAFFALPPLTTADGLPTNALYGFTTMLLKVLEEEQPDVLLLALEGGRTFRHHEFADYKAHRPRMPDDLAAQAPLVRDVAAAFRMPVLEQPGYEADDVIGTVACRAAEAGYEVVIVTGDLDALQLVGPRVRVLINRRGVSETQLYDEAAVRERFGLEPALLPDFKALKGDPSDNIPGLPGIGEKTASTLLARFGSLDELLARAGEVSAPKVRTALEEGSQSALLYRRLATIVCNLPLVTPWEAWSYPGPDAPRLRELFHRLEFRTLARRLPEAEPAAEDRSSTEEPAAAIPWRRVEAGEELDRFLAGARQAGWMAIRTLQHGGEGRSGRLRGIALSRGGETLVLASASGGEGLLAAADDPFTLPAPLDALLRDPALALAGHDLKRDFHALGLAAEPPERRACTGFDTLLAAYVLNPGRSTYRLDDLAQEHLRRPASAADPLEAAALEAAAVADLREPLEARLRADELDAVYFGLELPLVRLLGELEARGVAVNRAELARLSSWLAERMADLERQAHAAAGRAFSLGSPKQLQELLFVELGLPAGKKTKTGFSTDSDVLQDLAAVHPLPALVLEWREVAKLKSTYADALQNLLDPADGRIHTRLNQAVAATGRLSSSEPNLQNIPVRTEVGREIRAAFVPAAGMRLLSADYSQIELRIMAHVCRDPELVRAFREERDVHAATAARVFRVPLAEVTADQRRRAKTVNFAVLYGQREFGLSRQLRIEVREARELIDAYFAEFPGVLEYTQATLEQARRQGCVTTLPPYRRKRYIPGIHAGSRNERLAAEREAVNAPIQGTAADIIKAAMLRVDAAMREARLGSRMVLQVHDELLFEVLPAEEPAMAELVRRQMESAFELDVPLRVEIKTGTNWRDVTAVPHP